MATAPDIPNQLQAALKALQTYSITHLRTQDAIEDLLSLIKQRLVNQPIVNIAVAHGRLLADGMLMERKPNTELFIREMEARGILSIAIHRGISPREIKELLLLMDEPPERVAALGGPEAFFHGRQASSIRINETDIGFLVRQLGAEDTRPGLMIPPGGALPLLHTGPISVMASARSHGRSESALPPSLLDEHIQASMREPLLEKSTVNARSLLKEMLEGGCLECLGQAITQILEGLQNHDGAVRVKAKELLMGFIQEPIRPELPQQIFHQMVEGIFVLYPKQNATAKSEPERNLSLSLLLGQWFATGELDGAKQFLDSIPERLPHYGAELRHALMTSDELCKPMLMRFFREGHGILSNQVLPFFRWAGDPGARYLMRVLEQEPNRNHRHRVLQLLKELAPESLPAIRESLGSEPWYFARNILNLLGELEDRVSADAMEWAFKHADLRVRKAAVRAYWRSLKEDAKPVLLGFLPQTDQETQMEILAGLGHIKAVEAVGIVSAMASLAAEPLRIRALDCLGEIGDPSAIQTLSLHLKRKGRIFKSAESMPIRLAAARALARINTPLAFRVVQETFEDEPKGLDKDSFQKILALFSF